METAIKKSYEQKYLIPVKMDGIVPYEVIFLDPLFWQALGKACGWGEKDEETMHLIDLSGGIGKNMSHKHFEWSKQWHRFIDSLAEDKSPDEFFNQLLQ